MLSTILTLQPAAESNQITKISTTNSSVSRKTCFICDKKLPHEEMLCHVGTHILQDDVNGPNVCGFCGRDVCVIKLKKTSKKKSKQFYGIEEYDCEYYYNYGKTKKFNKIRNPCTNRVLPCPVGKCLSIVWVYNYQQHFNEKHANEEYPKEMLIEEVEVDFHKSKKKCI